MKVVIDYREQALFKELEKLAIGGGCGSGGGGELIFELKNLEIGDILIVSDDDETVPKLLIERKTVSDLASSINDGRYTEQSFRLNEYKQLINHNIYYFIEGTTLHTPQLYSALFSLSYYKGFSVLRTKNVSETALMITHIARKLAKEEGKRDAYYYLYEHKPDNISTELLLEKEEKEKEKEHYCNVLKKSKKSNCITPDNFGEILLCQIPGVSSVTAVAIMEHYKKFQLFLDDPQKETVLKSLKLKSQRKVSTTVIQNILKFVSEW